MSHRANDFGLAGRLKTVDPVTSGSPCGARFAPCPRGSAKLQQSALRHKSASFGCSDRDRWSDRQRASPDARHAQQADPPVRPADHGGNGLCPGNTQPF